MKSEEFSPIDHIPGKPPALQQAYSNPASDLEKAIIVDNEKQKRTLQVLHSAPEVPIYDRLVIQDNQVGPIMRQILLERKVNRLQFTKDYLPPNSMQRQKLIQSLINEL